MMVGVAPTGVDGTKDYSECAAGQKDTGYWFPNKIHNFQIKVYSKISRSVSNTVLIKIVISHVSRHFYITTDNFNNKSYIGPSKLLIKWSFKHQFCNVSFLKI